MCKEFIEAALPFFLGSAILLARSAVSRKRSTNFLPSRNSGGLCSNPGILQSMNSLRNNWSEAKLVKSVNSSMLNFTGMRIKGSPCGVLQRAD